MQETLLPCALDIVQMSLLHRTVFCCIACCCTSGIIHLLCTSCACLQDHWNWTAAFASPSMIRIWVHSQGHVVTVSISAPTCCHNLDQISPESERIHQVLEPSVKHSTALRGDVTEHATEQSKSKPRRCKLSCLCIQTASGHESNRQMAA